MRILPNIRLSVETDESTSPARQLEKIGLFARMGDHTLTETSEDDWDLDVSGSVSPPDRPGIGKFFRPPLLDTWDAICAAKLDRWTRSLFDFVTMNRWLAEHGKTLVVLDPMLDLSTPAGRAFASVIATFAEYEREMIATRTKEAYEALLRARRYRGGQISFGFMAVTRPGLPGQYLEPDPELAPVVREMCERYLRYESFGSIAKWLNETGVPTGMDAMRRRNGEDMRGTKWQAHTVRIVLKGPGILGAAVDASGEAVRDDDGDVIYMADPLTSRETWERVQARITANPRGAKTDTSALLHVAYCSCGSVMYATTTRKTERGKEYEYRYYACHGRKGYDRERTCDAPRIKAKALENAVSGALLDLVGRYELVEKRLTPGRDYAEEIARMKDRLSRLSGDIEMGEALGDDVTDLTAKRNRARTELRRLVGLEPVAATVKTVKTGTKFRQHWESLGTVQKNEFLRSAGVRVLAHKDDLPALDLPAGPLTALEIPHSVIIDEPELKAVVNLGGLAELLDLAGAR
jgi:site-specific DNA recombinase